MATLNRDKLVLSTGTEIYVHRGVIGISEELRPMEGWDGGIELMDYKHYDERDLTLSAAERAELADYVIELWQKFKALTDADIVRS